MRFEVGPDRPLFELSNVSVRLGDKEALKRVTVSIPGGGIVAICGRSASGKSTLLNALGLLRVGRHEGTVRYNPPKGQGDTVTFDKIDAAEATRCRSQQFGFILQSSYLLPFLKAVENAQLPLLIRNTTGEDRQAAFARITTQLNGVADSSDSQDDLREAACNLPGSISGGQKQRFGILRALIHDPLVVFADEPCASLDPGLRRNVMELLRDWKNSGHSDGERTLFLVSHDMDAVVEYADHLLIIDNGRLVEDCLFARRDLPNENHAAAKWIEQKIDDAHRKTADPIEEELNHQEVIKDDPSDSSMAPDGHDAAIPGRGGENYPQSEQGHDSGAEEQNISLAAKETLRPLPYVDAGHFAWKALACNRFRKAVSGAICLTLALVCAAGSLTWGLLDGAERVSDHRLRSRPLSRRLLLGHQKINLTDANVEELSGRIQAVVSVDAVSPFSVLTWEMFSDHLVGDGVFNGRTINLSASWAVDPATPGFKVDEFDDKNELHPLLDGLKLRVNRWADLEKSARTRGIILCPRLLHRLYGNAKLPEADLPQTVKVGFRDGRLVGNGTANVPIIGVVDRNPPQEVYFFCPRIFEKELSTNVSISDIRVRIDKKLTEDELGAWQQALDDVVQSMQAEESADGSGEGLIIPAESLVLSRDGKRKRILIRNDAHDSYQLGRKDWVAILSGLWHQLRLADSGLVDFEDATIREGNPDALIGYNMIGIFLDDIYEMPQAVDAVKTDVNLEGEVDRVLAELVLQLESFSESKDIVSNSTCIVLAALCFVSLVVIQILRFSSRRSEAAMLQVVGFTKTDLRRIVVVDSTIIWLYGVLGSMLFSMAAGRIIVSCQYDSTLERGMAFQFEMMHHGCIAMASFGIVLGSGVYASYKTWGQTSPADLFDN